MKLDTIYLLIGSLQFLSLCLIECHQTTIEPGRNVHVAVNEQFTLSLRTLTDEEIFYDWKVLDNGYKAIQYSQYSEDFTVSYSEGPTGDNSFVWKNISLTGSFGSPKGLVLFYLSRQGVSKLDKFYTQVGVSAAETTVAAAPITTASTRAPSNINVKKMPPKPSGFVLSSPNQGEVQLDWKVYPSKGPHCLTYFNISYKSAFEKSEMSSLEWIQLEQQVINILDSKAGTYSYTLGGITLGNFVKFNILSHCSSNGETKYKVSSEFLVEEHVAPKISSFPESRNVTEGETVTLICNADGYPALNFEWSKSISSLDDNFQNDAVYQDGSILTFPLVSRDDEGKYYCTASNSPNGTYMSDKRGITLYVTPTIPITVVPSCALATINDCSPFLNESRFYALSLEEELRAESLKNYLLSITSTSETNPCYRAGMKYLCNNIFRPCNPTDNPIKVVAPIDDYCNKDCIDFWYSNCVESWDEFAVSDFFRSFSWLRDCGDITSTPQTCTPLGIKAILSAKTVPSTGPEFPTATGQPEIDSTTVPLIIGIVIIFVIIIIIIIGIVLLCVLYYRQVNKPQFCSSKFTESKVAENQFYLPFNTKTTMTDKKEFPRSAVRFLRKLGQGQFGSVDLAEASSIIPGEKVTLVAVKTLHDGATMKNRMDFEREADIMLRFDHPNILQLLGVSFKDKSAPLCLIFEYMEKGDLNNYLRGCASSYIKRFKNPIPARSRTESELSDDPPVLSTNDLVNICNQIAGGMHYLSVRSFVHRDLATRNCLVGKNLVVKIGDFGMSKDVYKSDYYRIGREALLPIKWMAPEAIMYGKATIQTDIWSFGVLMWEVFSFAMQPWYGFTNEQVIEKVKEGEILSRPDNCPPMVYSLMLECWDMDASKRIGFESILQRLNSWRLSSTESASFPDIALETSDPFDDEIIQVTPI